MNVISKHFKIAGWWFVDLSVSSLWRVSLHVKCVHSWERDRERGADTNQDLAVSITHDLMRALCERKQCLICCSTHPAVSTFFSTNLLYQDFSFTDHYWSGSCKCCFLILLDSSSSQVVTFMFYKSCCTVKPVQLSCFTDSFNNVCCTLYVQV